MPSRRATLCVLLAIAMAPGCTPAPSAGDDNDSSEAGDDDDSAPLADDDDSGAADDDDTTEPPVEVCWDGNGDHLTIQGALDAAPDGATVLVCPGVYAENLLVEARDLSVRSTDGAEVTTVLGDGSGPVWQVLDGAALVIEGLTISGGIAEDGGGGLHAEDAALEVRDSVLTGNTGGFGGGLLARGGTLVLSRSTLSFNEAAHGGGGAYVDACEGEIHDSLFHDNLSELGGGLGVLDGAMEVRDSEFRDNEANASDDSSGGGGIWAYGDVDIVCNTLTGNRSDRYAGGLFALGGSGDILGNRISENSSGDDGGGVYLYTSSAWFSGNEVTHNTSSDDAGGLRTKTSSARIEDNVLSFNTADSQGGGAKLSHAANVFVGNIIEGNVAGTEGGGVELDNDATTVSDCTFLDNSGRYGGGLHSVDTPAELLIEDSTFQGNTATHCGGGIYIEDEPYEVTVTHIVARENAAAWGGGICVRWSDAIVRNSVVFGNTASSGGGAFYFEDVEGWLQQVSAVANSSPSGSGVYLTETSALEVVNTIVTNNIAGAGVYVSGTAPALWAYNDVFGNDVADFTGMADPTGVDGNLSADPRFVDGANGDLLLDVASPCLDAGHPALLDADGTRSDMGAFGGPYGSWP